MQNVFVPVVCPACGRHSAMRFQRADLREQFERRAVLELRCDYDSHTWPAGFRERIGLRRLLDERDLSVRSFFDLSPPDTTLPNPA